MAVSARGPRQKGGDYRGTGRLQFPDGSFGNGGAMRIAPVGLVYRYAAPEVLHQAVEDALLCTHVHPEAVDGAFIQAKAVAVAVTSTPAEFDPHALLRELHQISRTTVVRLKLEALTRGLEEHHADSLVIAKVGTGIRASEAVAAALWAFLCYGADPEQCVVRAVGFGGDTDTIGAMAGALAGALHGRSWIPSRWYDNIENGPDGRGQIVQVASRLASLSCGSD